MSNLRVEDLLAGVGRGSDIGYPMFPLNKINLIL